MPDEIEMSLAMTLPVESAPALSNKRRREEKSITRSSDIWFDDGNIILESEGTQFKVHRSVLSHHSSIFRDMFSIPQPSAELQTDGCPVVYLYDSAEDLALVIGILYGSLTIIKSGKPLSISAIGAMLRLGRKYDLEHIRQEALDCLTREFPIDLDARDSAVSKGWTTITSNRSPLIIELMNVALENAIQTVLPDAYFECIGTLSQVIEGSKLVSGDDQNIIHLPDDALRTCIRGRQRVIEDLPKLTLRHLSDESVLPCQECLSLKHCRKIRKDLAFKFWIPEPDVSSAFCRWDANENLSLGANLCTACIIRAKELHEIGRRTMWDKLPGYFDLPDWDQLENFIS